MKVRIFPRRDRAVWAAGILALTAACLGPIETVETFVYEGTLLGQGAVELGGTVGMVIGFDRTQIGIGVSTAQPGDQYGWAVRNGTCGSGGTTVASAAVFPPFTIGSGGTGGSETVINRRLDASQSYSAAVFTPPGGGGADIACANLTRAN